MVIIFIVLDSKNILVVEDDLDIRELISFNLANEGHQVFEANDGEVGIDKARNNLNQINKGKLEVIARQVGINNGSRMTAKALRERILNLYKSRLGVNTRVNPSAVASYPRGPVQGNLFT